MLEQQFVTFLVSRIEVKLANIRKYTSDENAKFAVEETQVFVDQLKETMSTIIAGDTRQSNDKQFTKIHFKRYPNSLANNRLNGVYRILSVESGIFPIKK